MVLSRLAPVPVIPAIVLAACLALAGCGKSSESEARREAPRPVRVQTVALAPLATGLAYSGTVQARRLADLAFRVAGKVVERPVDVGARVAQGAVLARLDRADLQLSLEAAESAVAAAAADAANARADLARYEGLGRGSPAYLASEFDKRQAAQRMADARLAQATRQRALARDQLAYGILTADADGIVTALPVEVGQVVAAGQTVASLAHTAETEVVVDVPENRLPEVRAAGGIRVALWAAPDRPLTGRIREIAGRADPASRTFAVKVTVLDPPDGLLALGMTAIVRFDRPGGPPVALLPATALTDQDGQPAVWVLDPAQRRASLRPVTVAGYGGDGSVAIARGLADGDQVVTAGTGRIDAAMPLVAWAGPAR